MLEWVAWLALGDLEGGELSLTSLKPLVLQSVAIISTRVLITVIELTSFTILSQALDSIFNDIEFYRTILPISGTFNLDYD